MPNTNALAVSLRKLGLKQLRSMLERKGRVCKGCSEKEHFVQELLRGDGVQTGVSDGGGTDSIADIVQSYINYVYYYPITTLQIVAIVCAVGYFLYLLATGQLVKKSGKKHVKSSSRDILLQRKAK